MLKKVPDCLFRMIVDYLSNRWVIYEGDKWYLKEEMSYGATQGLWAGPLMWNVMYDVFLRMDLPAGMSITGFTNDALVFGVQSVGWITGLRMAPEKTEALLDTDRRSFQHPKIVLGEHEVV